MMSADQKPDLATQAKRLREETCKLLGLDIDKLTAAQLARVDRASVLRLRLRAGMSGFTESIGG
jgi:hypothetical protein